MVINCNYDLNYNKTVQWKFDAGAMKQSFHSGSMEAPGMTMELQYGRGPFADAVNGQFLYVLLYALLFVIQFIRAL